MIDGAMNKEQIARCVGRIVRLRPPASTPEGRRLDDDWRILSVTDNRIELRRVCDDAPLRLGLDHLHRYSSDPGRDDEPEAPYGYLVLIERVVCGNDGRFTVEIVIPGDLERQLGAKPAYSPDVLIETRAQCERLTALQREALRRLLLIGQMTDSQMQRYLNERGIAHGFDSALAQLSNETPFVRPALAETPHDRAMGYRGPYEINPVFREALSDVISGVSASTN